MMKAINQGVLVLNIRQWKRRNCVLPSKGVDAKHDY